MVDTPLPPANDGRDEPRNVNNQSLPASESPDLDAFGARFEAPPDEGAVQGAVQGSEERPERSSPIDLGHLAPRDLSVVQNKILPRPPTYDQLHRPLFPPVSDKP